ncbi:MAG: hypothetical protein WCK65_07975 [Rhodospirillaceae bacterium]
MQVAQIDQFTQLLMVLVVSLLLGIAATATFCRTVPQIMARLFRTVEAEQKYLALLKDGYTLRERVRSLRNESDAFADRLSSQETVLRRLRRQIAHANSRVPDLIHEVGEPRSGNNKYLVRLSVESTSALIRTTSELYNPMWHHTNLIEVWAGSREEARHLAELAYSDKLGYQKSFIESNRLASPGGLY